MTGGYRLMVESGVAADLREIGKYWRYPKVLAHINCIVTL